MSTLRNFPNNFFWSDRRRTQGGERHEENFWGAAINVLYIDLVLHLNINCTYQESLSSTIRISTLRPLHYFGYILSQCTRNNFPIKWLLQQKRFGFVHLPGSENCGPQTTCPFYQWGFTGTARLLPHWASGWVAVMKT